MKMRSDGCGLVMDAKQMKHSCRVSVTGGGGGVAVSHLRGDLGQGARARGDGAHRTPAGGGGADLSGARPRSRVVPLDAGTQSARRVLPSGGSSRELLEGLPENSPQPKETISLAFSTFKTDMLPFPRFAHRCRSIGFQKK